MYINSLFMWQLQYTINKLLVASVNLKSAETERCRKFDVFRETTVILDAKIKVVASRKLQWFFSCTLTEMACSGVYTLHCVC